MTERRRGPGRTRVNQEEAEGGDPNVNLMTQMMQQQVMQHQQMIQMMQQKIHQQAQSQQQWAQMMQQGQGFHPQPPPPPVVGNPAFREYNRNHLPEFNGEGNPQEAKRSSPRTPPTCNRCGKAHKGECMKGSRICYGCHHPGHYISECPIRHSKNAAEGTTTSKGRVYTLDGKKAQTNEDLIADLQVSRSKGKQKATD